MNINLTVGKVYQNKQVVEMKHSAKILGSGSLEVFATPAMVAFMENTAKMVDNELENGYGTVGIAISTTHVKATAIGKVVECEAKLTEIDRKKLSFTIKAWDEEGTIGESTHTRYIINEEEFMARVNK